MVTTSYDGNRGNRGSVFVVTDWTEDLALDCDSDDADLGDVLGTVIKELIQKGILNGSVVHK